MLKILIPESEYFDSKTNEFIYTKKQELLLEHSLMSISKWESKWKKPFFSKEKKTLPETIDYVRCMTITKSVDPLIYKGLTRDAMEQINQYIEDPMTATWFSDDKSKGRNREIVTAELVYYWMIALGIPFECQKWHFNKLLALIRVCNIKNDESNGGKKMSKRATMQSYNEINAARRKAMRTKG